MPFHPTGSSQKLTLVASIAQTVEMAGLPTENGVIRIVPITAQSKATMFVAFGDQDVSANDVTCMPLPVVVLSEQIVSVGDATHIALLMQGANSYDIRITPGEIV